MNRDTVWFELMEKMDGGECPVCALTAEMLKREMDAFLYASVNDRGLRKNITESHGFCTRHAYLLMSKGDPVAHAILYQGLLESECVGLTPDARASAGRDHSGCMFCRSVEECGRSYAKAFASFWNDAEFREKYKRCGILCVPHLDLVRSFQKDNRAVAALNRETREKYEVLLQNLSEILRKSDYRHANEALTADERTAWKRAVAVVNGCEDCR